MTTKKTKFTIGGIAASSFLALAWLISNTNAGVDLWSKLQDKRAHVIARVIKGSTQRLTADELVIRISNPTNKQESLSEPTFECESPEGTKQLFHVWNDMPVPAPSPTFPPHRSFPTDLAAGSTAEATLFIRKLPGVASIRDCKGLRFSWIDGTQERKFGDVISVAPNTAMFVITGPRGG
jgi:hypothetical protein